jgi:hypothetical protein
VVEAVAAERPARVIRSRTTGVIGADVTAMNTLPGIIAEQSDLNDKMMLRCAVREEGRIDMSNIAIVVCDGLTERIIRMAGVDDARLDVLRQLDRSKMQQEMGKAFNSDSGIVRVKNADQLIGKMRSLFGKNLKVVILDDGTLTEELRKRQDEIPGMPGVDYCVVQTGIPEINVDLEVPYMNLSAMARIGVAVLERDYRLYCLAYKAFCGEAPPENQAQFEAFTKEARWIIYVLPCSAPFPPDEAWERRRLQELFNVSV